MIEQVMRTTAAAAAGDEMPSGGPARRYMVIVVDSKTQRVLSAACQMHHLVEDGVCLVESINTAREGLPSLDCIYFIEPTLQNIAALVKDASSKAMYRSYHAFFSHGLPPELLQVVANSREAAARMRSFVELNLGIVTLDSRSFHADDGGAALASILDDDMLKEEDATIAASQLASLCVTMGVFQPRMFYSAKSSGMKSGKGMCHQIAERLDARLKEIQSQGTISAQCGRGGDFQPCSVVIIERSFDWASSLALDMTYEPLVFDILGGSSIKVDECTFRYVDHNDEQVTRNAVLSQEADSLWEKYRFMPVWLVNDLIVEEVKQYARKDEEMKSSNKRQSIAETLQALQSLPAHKEYFTKLQVHSDICNQCFAELEAKRLVSVCALEQDLITRADSSNAESAWKLEKQLKVMLQDAELSPEAKMRLLLLYFATTESDVSLQKRSELTQVASFERKDEDTAQSHRWGNAVEQARERYPIRAKTATRRKQRLLQWTQAKGSSNPQDVKLRRYQPRCRELLEDACAGRLDAGDFVELGARASGPSAAASTPKSVVLFIVGGLSLPEVRIAKEVASAQTGTEIFVGGSCLLTPQKVVDAIRPK